MPSAQQIGSALRASLDRLYLLCGYFAAGFLIIILLLIILQMLARWIGEMVPGTTYYAGYCMASASFFAFAYALNSGSHIRVTLFLSAIGRFRRFGEIWCFGIGTLLATYMSYYSIKATYWSFLLKDVSQGLDATPIWIPQLSMSIGSAIFAISLLDNFIRVLVFGTHLVKVQSVDSNTDTPIS